MAAPVRALLQQRDLTLSTPALLALSASCSAAFGAAVGAWTGGRQILYAALKMPLFLFATLALSFAALHVLAASRFPARMTFSIAAETIAVTAVVLGALAPIAALFSLACPRPSPAGYRFLIMALTLSVAAGGIAGVARCRARLGSRGLTAAWILVYQFTGAQMAWLLKPWVGYTVRDDRFIPLRENLQGNFYESVYGVLRALLT